MVLQWLAVASIIVFILYKSTKGIPSGAPPGPLRLPLIGNLHQLGADPVAGLTKLSKIYPDGIYSIQLGDYFSVVVSRHSLAIEIYKRYGSKTSGRFSTRVTNALLGVNKDFIFGTYSDEWKSLKKFLHNALFVPTVLQKVSPIMQRECDNLSKEWEQNAKEGTPVDVSVSLCSATMRVMFSVLFGRYINPEETEKLLPIMQEVFYYLGTGDPSDFISILKPLPIPKKTKTVLKQFRDFVLEQIKIHKEGLEEPQDFTDYLLASRDSGELPSNVDLSDDVICGILLDLLAAGTDTSSVLTSWTILLSVYFPHVQQKIHKEIDEVGSTDMAQLPFLQATLKEASRYRPPGPLGIPHLVQEEVQVAGYIIPEGTIVHHNIFASNFHEKDWKNPQEFRPERFLEEEKDNPVLVFGTGARECLGSNFAKQMLNMSLPQIFSKFKFSPIKPIDINPVFGLTYTPKHQNISVSLR